MNLLEIPTVLGLSHKIPTDQFSLAQSGRSVCLKTGANIFLAEYDQWVLTDLFLTGPVFHFWVVSAAHVSLNKYSSRVNLIVHSLGRPLIRGRECLATIGNCSGYSYAGYRLMQGTDECLIIDEEEKE